MNLTDFLESEAQKAQAAGLEYFFTIKLGWNQYNRLPYDSFWWQGLDGTRVLTHFSTTPQRGSVHASTYNASASPEQVLVDDVVVDQCAVVDQLEGEERLLCIPEVPSRDLGAEGANDRPEAFAAARDGVFRRDAEDGVDVREVQFLYRILNECQLLAQGFIEMCQALSPRLSNP